MVANTSQHVVVLIQENKTPDFAFRSLAAFGADIAVSPAPLSVAPDYDQPHDRSAWVHYRMGDYPAVTTQIDNDVLQPLYAWLGKSFTFCDHHFGLGTNSTSGHLLAIGGQTPTLKNPPFGPGGPQWDMPSIFVHAENAGLSWAAVADQDHYPVKFYTELGTAGRAANISAARVGEPDPFVTLAQSGKFPNLTYVWSPSGFDEHPPYLKSDPGYLQRGHDLTWQRVDAVVKAGLWDTTTFILTWDDWGGYADHVSTPVSETVIDPLHPAGFPIIGGSRIPLVMFGGHVSHGIDTTWRSHAAIPKTVIDLFGLAPMGVPRVDTAIGLTGNVRLKGATRPVPPAFGAAITQPVPPVKRPVPKPPSPWTGPTNAPLGPVVLNGAKTLPAPDDAVVHKAPPKLPPLAPH